ncbi:MAG: 1,4-alpha-glucan branching protein GlgB [Rhodobacterales bacterium]|nr:1,4-alpha-glucan branching protein GlgB [Rhodobacterales bacterium]
MTALITADHGDPFAVLGPHGVEGGLVVRVLRPDAMGIDLVSADTGKTIMALEKIHADGLFAGFVAGADPSLRYRLAVHRPDGSRQEDDPYAFPAFLGEQDQYYLSEGRHFHSYRRLGAHLMELEGVEGTAFAVWAPNARRVSLVGDFNGWDGRRHMMRKHPGCGVWEIFVPGLGRGAFYKFEIKAANGGLLPLKADPYAFRCEHPPRTASVVEGVNSYDWSDGHWMRSRAERHDNSAPIAVYEVHLGSWMRVPEDGGRSLSYLELAEKLVPYVADMGFTHIELLPVSEHPFDGSWGYQPIGLFAPTIRHGTPDEFKFFINACHRAGLGVILDWVPGHFPEDPHGLVHFDGTALYEHADPRQGRHQDWGTLIYNFDRTEVSNFLISNALFWLDQYHIDGLRVDAVASMLYLDYSRNEGEWVPNKYGGRENLGAIAFMKALNEMVYGEFPGAFTVAEESTAWPGVSKPTYLGGLGFGFKWNMGWMHDSLRYIGLDPVYRKFHQNDLTFGLLYAFAENFMLPLSHDEVVHGKGSLMGRMPGDLWQKAANLRLYFTFLFTHPGKKLLFMGGEFGQNDEWNHNKSLDWHLLEFERHSGIRTLVGDLCRMYRRHPALHTGDNQSEGFSWIDCNDSDNSTISFVRYDPTGLGPPILAVFNFTPVPRRNYRVGVPLAGAYDEIMNSDAALYGGSDSGNLGQVSTEDHASHGHAQSLCLTLPPLGAVVLRPAGD